MLECSVVHHARNSPGDHDFDAGAQKAPEDFVEGGVRVTDVGVFILNDGRSDGGGVGQLGVEYEDACCHGLQLQ